MSNSSTISFGRLLGVRRPGAALVFDHEIENKAAPGRRTPRRCFNLIFFVCFATTALAQTPSPTPPDKRGLGIQSDGAPASGTADQRAREAKPELVLQTGYNNFYGATRLV